MRYSTEGLKREDLIAPPGAQVLPRVSLEDVQMGVGDDGEPFLVITGGILTKEFETVTRQFRISPQAAKEAASAITKVAEALAMYDHHKNGPF